MNKVDWLVSSHLDDEDDMEIKSYKSRLEKKIEDLEKKVDQLSQDMRHLRKYGNENTGGKIFC